MAEAGDLKMAHRWGFPRFITKPHSEEEVGCEPRLRKLPQIWGSPLIFLELLKLATTNYGAYKNR